MGGVVDGEVVTSSDSYDHLDIAFDSSGNLHEIVDEDHFVLEEGTWRKLSKHPCVKLIRGGQDLFCLSRVEGKDVGAPGNWDWYIIAGAGYGGPGCCLIPWHSHPDKLVLARKTPAGWSKLALLDVEAKFEIKNPSIAADKSGTLHVLHKTEEGGSVRDEQCAYVRIEPMTLGESSESNQSFSSDHEEAPPTLAKVSGRAVITRRFSLLLECHDIAADPETGTVLITVIEYNDYGGRYRSYSYCYIVEDGEIGRQIPMYDFDGVIHVEPGGGGRFLALVGWTRPTQCTFTTWNTTMACGLPQWN
jgi:nitrate reductase cytochrome c-type subunit